MSVIPRYLWAVLGLATLGFSANAEAALVQITDSQGRPIPGASIEAFRIPARASLIEMRRDAVARGRTGADGHLELALPRLDRLWLSVDQAEYLPLQTTVVPRTQTLVFSLVKATPLRGRVVGASSHPIAGTACASWRQAAAPLGREFAFERCGPLSPTGDFSLSGVDLRASGELKIQATAYLPLTARLPLTPAQERVFRLQPGIEITGLVTAPNRAPISLARLACREGGEAETSRDGRFALRLARLPAVVTVEARGFRRREIELTREPLSSPIVLTPGPTLEAQVLDDDGIPLKATLLRLSFETRPGNWTAQRLDPALREGRFRLDLSSAGTYRLTVQAVGHRPWESGAFSVAATEGIDLGVLQLTTGSGIEGRTIDAASGKAVPGVLVSLLPQGISGLRRLGSTPLAQTVTGRDGRYQLVGQSEGAYELRFECAGFATALREVEIPDQRIVAAEDQEMGPGVAISGRVRSRTGQPRPGLTLRFLAESGSSPIPLAESSTGSQGRFATLHLSPGRYRVEVRAERPLLSQGIEVQAGETEMSLDLVTPGTALAGRVLHGDEPLAGGRLTAEPAPLASPKVGTLLLEGPSGPPEVFGPPEVRVTTEVDGEGGFRFAEIEPGQTLFRYLSPEGREWAQVTEVPADDAVFLPLVFGGKTLHGEVRNRESGEPLTGVALRLSDATGSPLAAGATDDLGRFVFTDVSADEVVVEATQDGYRQETVRTSLAAAQPPPILVQLEPADAAAVVVRMAHASGQPLAFAFVSLLSPTGALVRSLPLDETGEKRFVDLPAGLYHLIWSDPAVGVGASPALTLRSGEEALFERRLLAPARLELLCEAALCGGSPFQTLALVTGAVDVAPLLPGAGAGPTFSPEGRAFLGALQPGDYRLLVRAAGRTWDLPFHAQPGQTLLLPVGGSDIQVPSGS